jgi:hypothetical protein
MLEDVKDVLIWSPQPQPPLSQEDEATLPTGTYGTYYTYGTVLRIRDVYPGSWVSIPDPGSASKNLRILKKCLVPVCRGQKGTGSRIRIRNTAYDISKMLTWILKSSGLCLLSSSKVSVQDLPVFLCLLVVLTWSRQIN